MHWTNSGYSTKIYQLNGRRRRNTRWFWAVVFVSDILILGFIAAMLLSGSVSNAVLNVLIPK